MTEPARPPTNVTGIAGIFEAGLAFLAIAIGYLVGHPPMQSVQWSLRALPDNAVAVLWGTLAALPLLAGMWLSDRSRFRPFIRLSRIVRRLIVPLFRHASLAELALIALLAGVGEELLFRGLLQDGLAVWIGGTAGICVGVAAASLVFGLAHALTRTYAVLATLVGGYLGIVFWLTGNLLAPIAAHAVYDFFALIFLLSGRSRSN